MEKLCSRILLSIQVFHCSPILSPHIRHDVRLLVKLWKIYDLRSAYSYSLFTDLYRTYRVRSHSVLSEQGLDGFARSDWYIQYFSICGLFARSIRKIYSLQIQIFRIFVISIDQKNSIVRNHRIQTRQVFSIFTKPRILDQAID